MAVHAGHPPIPITITEKFDNTEQWPHSFSADTRPCVENMSREEGIERWTKLFGVPALIERCTDGLADEAERLARLSNSSSAPPHHQSSLAWTSIPLPGQDQCNLLAKSSIALGRLDHLRLHAKALGQAWIKELRQAERLYRAS